jgi:hypothetical protein
VTGDEERWAMVEQALTAPELETPLSRLIAISSIVESRKPTTDDDVHRYENVSGCPYGEAHGTVTYVANNGWLHCAGCAVRLAGDVLCD